MRAGDLLEVRSHPRGHKPEVPLQLFPIHRRKAIADTLKMMWSDVILANIAQGLSDEAARPAGQSEIPPAIATENDPELTEIDAGAGAVGVINDLRGYLSIKPKPIRSDGLGGKNSEVFISSHGRDNSVGGGPCLSKNGMGLGGIVDSPADPANFPVAHQPRERHPDRSRVAKIGKIVGRECPTATFSGDSPKNLPRVRDRRRGRVHVENNALFFQRRKSRLND
jgi:hypothetical protein